MSQELSPAYIEGFAAKCAEAGIDAHQLLELTKEGADKQAGILDALKRLLNGGHPRVTSDPTIPLSSQIPIAKLREIYGGPLNKRQPVKIPKTPQGNPLINGGVPLGQQVNAQGKLAPTSYIGQ